MAKFYICKNCGNIIEMVKDKCPAITCCGEKVTELVPGTSDGAKEKHVPVCKVEGNKVTVVVGEVAHPMTEAHLIEWIAIETTQGIQRKNLTADDKPEAEFLLTDGDTVKEVYAYCNLHGLYKA